MARLESAIKAYVDYRGEMAIKNSILPGMDVDDDDDSTTPTKDYKANVISSSDA